MEEDLAWLKALLIEHGGIELVVAIERAGREELPPLDTRGELRLLLYELEAVLVHGFKTVAYTMGKLKAQKLVIRADPSTNSREESVLSRGARERAEHVVISQDSLAEWSEIAAEAEAILKDMRLRYDFV
jgi:hypothetical protein